MKIYKAAAAAMAAPKTKINKTIPIKDITSPAIDRPFGDLNTPIKEKISPNNHTIHPKIGIHPKNKPIKASTNPAVPIPFDSCLPLLFSDIF